MTRTAQTIIVTVIATIILLSLIGLGPTQAAKSNTFYQEANFNWLQPVANLLSQIIPDFKIDFANSGELELIFILGTVCFGYWAIMLTVSKDWKAAPLLWLATALCIIILMISGLIQGTFM